MGTPSTTPRLPHPPAAPAPMPITTACDHLMPELRLPPPIMTTQNVHLPSIPSTQHSFTPYHHHHRHPQPVNPVSTFTLGKQQFPTTAAFRTRQSTIEPSPTHCQIVPGCFSVTNSIMDCASPAQSPGPSAHLSLARAQELTTIGCVPSEADQ